MADDRLDLASLTTLHWIGVVAASISGTIHLVLGVADITSPIGLSFVAAGLGFYGAIALFLLGVARRLVSVVGIPFVLAQIALWYLFNFVGTGRSFPADAGPLGLIDKTVQVLLLVVLVLLLTRERAAR
mgnify:CR=1 FL=1